MTLNFKNKTNDEIQQWVLKTLEEAWQYEPEKRAEVVRQVMEFLNDNLDASFVEFIMQLRGRDCFEKHKKGMLGDVPDSVHNILDFINYLDQRWASFNGGITEGLKRNGNVLIARIFKCPCDFVNSSEELIPKSYCHCSAGFYRSIFEGYLGVTVKVEIISSIMSGADKCEIKITLPEEVLKGYD